MIRQERPSAIRGLLRVLIAASVLGGAAAAAYLLSRANYPLFHSIADMATVFVAGSVFLVVWHGRRQLDNDYFLLIAIAFLAFALLDFMHIIGNKGMGVFPEYGNLGPTFYVASRYVLGVSFLLAPLFIKRKVSTVPVFAASLLVVALVLLSVLHWRNFPTTYFEDAGGKGHLTTFKVYSDYAVCLMLLGGLGLLLLNRRAFDARVLRNIAFSLVLSIATGLAFTLYTDPFGITNAVGHLFQLASFYLIYRGFVATVLTKPQDILYRNLKQSNDSILELNSELEQVNLRLSNDIAARRRAEQALRKSEEGLRLFIEHAPAALAMFDLQMRYVSVSRRWLSDYGLQGRDVLGLSHYDVFPEITEAWREVHRRGLAGEVMRAEEDRFDRADGSVQWLRWEVHPWHDEGGQVGGIVIFTEDITERKRVEEALRFANERLEQRVAERTAELAAAMDKVMQERQRFLDVLETLPVILVLLRPDHRVVWVNGAYRRALGDNVGKLCFAAQFGRERPCEECQAFVPLKDGKPHNWEWALPNGRTFDIYNFPLADTDGSPMILEMDIDVTEQRKAQQQLDLAHAELGKRAELLRALASELTLSEQRERRRLAEVLHDNLQQLLVGAKLRLSLLERTADGPTKRVTDQVQDLLDESIECSRSLTSELSPPILHQGGLTPALNWLALWMQQKHAFNVELDTDGSVEPQAEEMKVLLFQSVRELLFNAVKHAKVGSARIRLQRSNGHIELTVSDQGVGFDPNTAAPRPGKSGGFGLFSIRERLDLLGGRLEIDSAPGRGSRFRMLAPETPSASRGQ